MALTDLPPTGPGDPPPERGGDPWGIGPPPPPGAHLDREPPRWTRWAIPTATAVSVAAVGAYMFFVDPNEAANPYPKCPLKAATGIDCPGCGGLRCTHALLHGDIAGAASMNLLAFIMMPVFLYVLVRWALSYAGVELPFPRIPRWMAISIGVFVLAFSVLRNIPNTPFYALNSSA